MRLALFQPDNPQNAGALVRLAACFGVPLDVIEPCGFPWDDRRLKRVAMDYVGLTPIVRHASWARFNAARAGRLVLLTTAGTLRYDRFAFRPDDVLMVGRESAGAPPEVHAAADARLVIPLAPGARSLNVATAAAIALAEAKRQAEIMPEAKRQAEIMPEAKRQAKSTPEAAE
jgi:tRNA (cytidine/uridine-2'-O-)-methyltransferase